MKFKSPGERFFFASKVALSADGRPSGTRASCQNDESNTAIERDMASSFRQQSKNSSKVTTPSWFKSIFCGKIGRGKPSERFSPIEFRPRGSIVSAMSACEMQHQTRTATNTTIFRWPWELINIQYIQAGQRQAFVHAPPLLPAFPLKFLTCQGDLCSKFSKQEKNSERGKNRSENYSFRARPRGKLRRRATLGGGETACGGENGSRGMVQRNRTKRIPETRCAQLSLLPLSLSVRSAALKRINYFVFNERLLSTNCRWKAEENGKQ